MIRWIPPAVIGLALVAAIAAALMTDQSWPPGTVSVRETGRLADGRLGESSGAARGRVNPGAIWTLNDSGHPPVLFAIDTTGRILAAVSIRGAVNRDWEAVSTGPCRDRSTSCLYIGDVGDNLGRRASVTIYRVAEPDLGAGAPDSAAVQDTAVIRYTSGAEDVEAMVAMPDGSVVLISKRLLGRPIVFVVPDSAWGGSPYQVPPADSLPLETGLFRGRLVTDAALSPSGRVLAVRTYRAIYLFAARQGGRLPGRPAAVCDIGRREPQGEGITFWNDTTMVLTSERVRGQPATVLLVTCDAP